MKHKVGDVVQIKSLDWYNKNKLWSGIRKSDGPSFVYDMSVYCGIKAKITAVVDGYYFIDIDNGEWCWRDGYFEEDMQEDMVNHPSHYTWLKDKCGIEVIDITRHLDFVSGNIVKYALRASKKKEKGYTDKEKELEDWKKCKWYIEDKIKSLEEEIKNTH